MTTSAPLVSIVTPAYNEERHLAECIESIQAQTYPHWDYTIIDNCSTDGTREIAQAYASRDPRIHVRSNDAVVPVIANHNIAFRSISQDSYYCKLVGADDWLYPECLERMVGLAECHPNVAIVGCYQLFGTALDLRQCGRPALQLHAPGEEADAASLPFPATVLSGRDACRRYLLEDSHLFGAPTPLLFRADVVRSRPHFYATPQLHADACACFELLQQHDFGFVHQVLAFNRVRQRSLSAATLDEGRNFIEKISLANQYGPAVLSDNELDRCVRQKLAMYYYYAGSQLLRRRTIAFWREQKQELNNAGCALSIPRLLAYSLCYAIGTLDQAARQAVKGIRQEAPCG